MFWSWDITCIIFAFAGYEYIFYFSLFHVKPIFFRYHNVRIVLISMISFQQFNNSSNIMKFIVFFILGRTRQGVNVIVWILRLHLEFVAVFTRNEFQGFSFHRFSSLLHTFPSKEWKDIFASVIWGKKSHLFPGYSRAHNFP